MEGVQARWCCAGYARTVPRDFMAHDEGGVSPMTAYLLLHCKTWPASVSD